MEMLDLIMKIAEIKIITSGIAILVSLVIAIIYLKIK